MGATQPIFAGDKNYENPVNGGGYGNGYAAESKNPISPSRAQVNERRKHCQADINTLLQTSKLRGGATRKVEIESSYSNFESALQKAADELDTGDPPKVGWAVKLIAYYTRPTHKWPAVSLTLEKALQARKTLVSLTDEQTVNSVERKLYRFATPEDKSKYYMMPTE